jgi:hypothetical protein
LCRFGVEAYSWVLICNGSLLPPPHPQRVASGSSRKEDPVSSARTVWFVRYPDGEREYRTINGELSTGAIIRARGVLWEVTEIHDERTLVVATHTVDEAAPAAEPATLPTPLDDEPLTLDVMTVA